MSGPLEGIKVLELSRVGPGEFCTLMLADMGAEVIKIEAPPSAMPAAFGGSPGSAEARKLVANYLNRNKKSITLNLKDPSGQKILQELAKGADVLVEGFRPGVMKRLGGDYETLRQINPRLIYCSLSGFGQDGPYRDLPAHDINYLSLAGVLNLIGEPDQPPAIPLNIIADYAGASMHGMAGIMLALFARERTGKGQLVDISYLDTTFALLAASPPIIQYLMNGTVPGRGKGVFSGHYPYYAVYETKDNKLISIGCTEPWLWENFCNAVERPELKKVGPKLEDFSQPANEQHYKAKLELGELFRSKTQEEWFEFLSKADVCVGKVYEVEEVFADPQLRHRKMAFEVDHPQAGRVRQVGMALKLSETPGSVRSFAPYLGQHTEEILKGLGYSAEGIAQLREKQVI